ncbi:hypothetical protein Q73A0000_05155 [Kaistella flava (ex Peng et al. 2021)]|uniref:Uncharacterized protein n=1 Tax=Kaistella flava (ex Peng et al. 2021) TaxID=2038776 RepID=A0A7M2Y6C5_9FLAO|nr:hypothetical protein [Kaistella flava (ex Peng et al. 2021)]QOW09798.1 hypothetical protein Q73A0000_05155 [Kaistella flava (ex Peng et al. 2021)]
MIKQEQLWKHRLAAQTDEELIKSFNKEVCNPGWTTARGTYLHLMRNEFRNRSFDSSLIINENTFKLAKKIVIRNNIVVYREDL